MKPIAYFEERYKLTNQGDVYNLASNTFLSPSKQPNGYLGVALANGKGGIKRYTLHRLVALHYLPNPYQYDMVNHIDGNKLNNFVGNLEWCTAKENINHALKTGLRKGYMSADDKEMYLQEVLDGAVVADVALRIGRPPTGLNKMLRLTADRVNLRVEWDLEMKRRRRDVALRNLAKINNKNI